MFLKSTVQPVVGFVSRFFQDDPTTVAVKVTGIAIVAMLGYIWDAFTSLLFAMLLVLFCIDILLGILKDVDESPEGVDAFDWGEFANGFVKLMAAILGVALFRTADLVLETLNLTNGHKPVSTVALGAMCFGFFWSAFKSFCYFYPEVKDAVEARLRRITNHKDSE